MDQLLRFKGYHTLPNDNNEDVMALRLFWTLFLQTSQISRNDQSQNSSGCKSIIDYGNPLR